VSLLSHHRGEGETDTAEADISMKFDLDLSTQLLMLGRACLSELSLMASDPRKAGSETSVVDVALFTKLLKGCHLAAHLHHSLGGLPFSVDFANAHIIVKHLYSLMMHESGRTQLVAPVTYGDTDLDIDAVLEFHSSVAASKNMRALIVSALRLLTFVPITMDPAPLVFPAWSLLISQLLLQSQTESVSPRL
jgi:hypothetical protein